MRRVLTIALPALLLLSCSVGSREESSEVLKKSAAASRQLLSARFDVTSEFTTNIPILGGLTNGQLQAHGALQSGGRAIDFELSFQGENAQQGEGNTITGAAQVIVAGEQEVYVMLKDLNVQSSQGFTVPLLPELKGTWWRMPAGTGAAVTTSVSPDPEFLQMQLQTVTLLKDNGIERVNGQEAYHYGVVIDKAALAQYLHEISVKRGAPQPLDHIQASLEGLDINGEVWIDRDTYVLHRASWHVVSSGASGSDVIFTIQLSDHNGAVTITPPKDAQPLPTGIPLTLP